MTPAFPLLLMVGAEMGDLGLSVPILTLDMVADDVRDTGDAEGGWMPAGPAKEKILSPPALIAREVGVCERGLG